MNPGFNVYWEETEAGELLHIEQGHKHEGGEDHFVVLGPEEAAKLYALLATKFGEDDDG